MTAESPVSRRDVLRGGLASAVALAASACGGGSEEPAARTPQAIDRPTPTVSPTPASQAPPPPTPPAPPDPAAIGANELGVVPVMMYHRITPRIGSEFDMAPGDFRAELQRMFANGYRPVRTIDLARGALPVAAGYTPVVLTFDDGYPDQFGFDPATGAVDPASGVGIVIEVCRQFPDCPPAGSFYLNAAPFGLSDPEPRRLGLTTMHELGLELGNHTLGHDNLGKLDAAGVQQSIVQLQQLLRTAVPAAVVSTMALPFGVAPRDRDLARTGSWNGETYVHEGVLLVGAEPARSPFSGQFDPQRIPRIRSTSWEGGAMALASGYWLDYLDAHPDERYVAAGNPGRVTVPAARAGELAPAYADRLVTY